MQSAGRLPVVPCALKRTSIWPIWKNDLDSRAEAPLTCWAIRREECQSPQW